jgi:polynucleotide 5'-kinase involved in rRNA processing
MLHCLRSAATVADVVLVDTPGLVMGPAAQALWWTMQSVAKPGRIIVIQRQRECGAVLSGLNQDVSHIVTLAAPAGNVQRSPAQRQNHRKQVFARYFRQTCLYNVHLNGVAVRTARGVTGQGAVGHLVGLGDDDGVDRATDVIEGWQPAQNAAN